MRIWLISTPSFMLTNMGIIMFIRILWNISMPTIMPTYMHTILRILIIRLISMPTVMPTMFMICTMPICMLRILPINLIILMIMLMLRVAEYAKRFVAPVFVYCLSFFSSLALSC